MVILTGPVHPSSNYRLCFGVRGATALQLEMNHSVLLLGGCLPEMCIYMPTNFTAAGLATAVRVQTMDSEIWPGPNPQALGSVTMQLD